MSIYRRRCRRRNEHEAARVRDDIALIYVVRHRAKAFGIRFVSQRASGTRFDRGRVCAAATLNFANHYLNMRGGL